MNRLLILLLYMVGLLLPSRSATADAAGFLELWLQYDQGRLSIARESVQDGALPPARGELFQAGQWLIQVSDARGRILYSTAISDPTILISDRLVTDGPEPGLVIGERRAAPSALFAVTLPHDPRIAGLTIWRLKQDLVISPGPTGARRRRRQPLPTPPLAALQLVGTLSLAVR
jgi:hypothetical protein